MSILTKITSSGSYLFSRGSLVAAILAIAPSIATSDILWSADFESGDFNQWHMSNDLGTPNFSMIPTYGRPKPYGDGSLAAIVTNPVRQGLYAAKITVKNSQNGRETDDCDVPFPTCTQRRTELNAQATIPDYYNAMPYMAERWMSVSHYIPSDWDNGGSGWGPIIFQVKAREETGLSHCFAIELIRGTWKLRHSWSATSSQSPYPWQYQMFYAGDEGGQPYPRSDSWPDGLLDFPDVVASRTALGSVNKGGWTDWVVHIKYDARGISAGGTGFLTVWKREDNDSWVKVLHILPKVTTRGGMTFDHGIGFYKPATGSTNGGFGIKTGLYMAKDQVWGLSANRVLYVDNLKVGSQAATFAMMSPDGSTPGTVTTNAELHPKPPTLLTVE